jgi:hypothetical protein
MIGLGCLSVEAALVNGGFEDGLGQSAWNQASTNFPSGVICDLATCDDGSGGTTAAPRTGDFWAFFGGVVGAAEDASLSQTFAFPTGPSTLSFYLWIGTEAGGSADFLRVLVDNNQIFEALGTDYAQYGTYTRVDLDLAAYGDGATHELAFVFHSESNPDAALNVSVDDVEVNSNSVPEPASVVLCCSALVTLLWQRGRRRVRRR